MSLVCYCMPSQNSIILEKRMDFGGQRTKCLMLSLPLSYTHRANQNFSICEYFNRMTNLSQFVRNFPPTKPIQGISPS